MSKFAKRTINWVELEKRVPLPEKNKFLAFKAKSDSYFRKVLANPPKLPEIKWEEYQKTVPVSGLVDKFKNEYSSLQVPFPKDTLTAEVDKQWESLKPEIKAFCDGLQTEIEKHKKEVSRIKALPPFESMTMEMFCDLYPDQAPNFVERPTFWPHNPEEQLDYKPPQAGKDPKK